jgi:hypothetical protein
MDTRTREALALGTQVLRQFQVASRPFNPFRPLQEARNMGRRSTLVIAVIVSTLILSAAAPAQAAGVRLRVYQGNTSQRGRIWFLVGRDDEGRFVKSVSLEGTLTCEDATTRDWAGGWRFGPQHVRITDGAFSDDEVGPFVAAHFEGRLGTLSGEGTASLVIPTLTADEQAQLCTTGDLTWEVEFRRIIPLDKVAVPAGHVVRAA